MECSELLHTIDINEPEELAVDFELRHSISENVVDGSIQLLVSGGDGNYQFEWNNGSTSDQLTNLPKGNYSVWVEDGNGCQLNIEFTIEDLIDQIKPSEFLSPNNDGINDKFVIENIDRFPGNKLSIFNRWGVKVFEMKNYDNSWNGDSSISGFGGKGILPPGPYYYFLQLGDGNQPYKGYVEIYY